MLSAPNGFLHRDSLLAKFSFPLFLTERIGGSVFTRAKKCAIELMQKMHVYSNYTKGQKVLLIYLYNFNTVKIF